MKSTTTLYISREIHPRVKDMQLPRLGKPLHGLTVSLRYSSGFPCPCTVVVDSIYLSPHCRKDESSHPIVQDVQHSRLCKSLSVANLSYEDGI